jgi:hypothetical protein
MLTPISLRPRSRKQAQPQAWLSPLAVGHGDSALARLSDRRRSCKVATSPWSDAATSSSPRTATPLSHGRTYSIYPGEALDPVAIPATANAVLDRVARADLAGFWIHVDCDVLNPDVMPATGALEPGGPTGEELGTFLITLASHRRRSD